jgi:serine/threonine-protein kinase
LLYIKGGVLFGVPFDLDRLEVRGKPVRIMEGVAYSNAIGSAQFDVASAGTLIYRTGGTERVRLEWLEASGATRPLLPEAGEFRYPTISPGGDRVAFVTERGPNQELWTYDWQRDIRSRLTQGQMFNTNPSWSASGRYVLYQVPAGIAWVAADGSGASGTLLRSDPHKKLLFPSSFAPDGGRLAYYAGRPDLGGFDLWTVPVEEGASGPRAGNSEPFLRTPANEVHPTFSPDGHWIAYGSNESGIFQVYVVSYPDKSRKVQVSSDGGDFTVWSHVRHELFFRGGDNRIMVAAYEVKDGLFLPHKARVWSEVRLAELLNASRNFSMSADGTRAAVLMPAEAAQPAPGNHVVFVLNFFDDLCRRMHD